MVKSVLLTEDARDQFESCPLVIRSRLQAIFERLERWPMVSGHKAMTGTMKGHHRIRTGDYRVVFRIEPGRVVVVRIGNRRDVYED